MVFHNYPYWSRWTCPTLTQRKEEGRKMKSVNMNVIVCPPHPKPTILPPRRSIHNNSSSSLTPQHPLR